MASVHGGEESCTLANALGQAGVSLAAVADAAGVSKSRAAAWANGDAEPHLGHVRRMPRSVRRAIGAALVEGADAQVIPVPAVLFAKAVVQASGSLAGLLERIDALESGDRKAGMALLREVHALRERLGALEMGVRVAIGAGK